MLPAHLFALGGATPLSIQGNGNLVVQGNAFVNSAAVAAITMSGANSRLNVTGSLKILDGGTCTGCSAVKTSPFPIGSFPAPLPDPLGYLPAPNESGMAAGSCAAGVCVPGIYSQRLSVSASVTLQPGVYVFRKGLALSGQANVTGTGVFIFNGCAVGAPAGCAATEGSFAVSGQAAINITPMTTGTYQGVVLYQSRTNTSSVSISGGSNVMSLSGVTYAPASNQVALGAGGGGLRLGAVIGRSLVVNGNGTVTVNGS